MEISSFRPSQLDCNKKRTDINYKKTEWVLYPPDFQVLCMLALIRKINNQCKKLIKQAQEIHSRKFRSIQNLAAISANNSFQCIEPINKKLQALKETQEIYQQLKKSILGYLKLRKREYMKKAHLAVTHSPHSTCLFTTLDCQRTQNLQENILVNKSEEEKYLKFVSLKPSEQAIQIQSDLNKQKPLAYAFSRQLELTPKISQLTNNFLLDTHKNSSEQFANQQKSGSKTPKKYFTMRKLTNKFIERKKNEIYAFKKMNKTIQECYLRNQVTTTVEIFTIFSNNLSSIKNCISTNSYQIVKEPPQFQERVFSEISFICNKLKQSIDLFAEITQNSKQFFYMLKQFVYKRQDEVLENQQLGLYKKLNIQIKEFIAVCSFLADFVKNMLISPSFKFIIFGKMRTIQKMIPLFTEVRYTSNYLKKQLQNLDFRDTRIYGHKIKREVKPSEKWRYAYIKKYRSNHAIKKIRF